MTTSIGAVFYRRWLPRLVIFAALWWLLSEGVAASWKIGVIAVVAASWVSVALSRRLSPEGEMQSQARYISVVGLLQFIPYFLYQSLRGGLDVGLRALRPGLPIAPGFIDYRLQQLSHTEARLLFMSVVSLLPGSLSVDFDSEGGVVHVLNSTRVNIDELRACERRVAALFGDPGAEEGVP